ncbi:hypothetical protein SAMN05216378_1690 [Paenibacillus catalpae]|uniref:Uncharacterized protein n=1 Tax=Paenibacillus catalpae TaxID=1045775 RepID=A0A1I1VMI8_9BACL|nr:hypothetical protein [Paenibacillus catalpae]SFD84237.1 hypothetical protein SAMN05216378_1690 [Paenibacillus catalpae]
MKERVHTVHTKSNPSMLQRFIQQRPQSLQQGMQLAQFGSTGTRDPHGRTKTAVNV